MAKCQTFKILNFTVALAGDHRENGGAGKTRVKIFCGEEHLGAGSSVFDGLRFVYLQWCDSQV